jgi:hypothetical protein
VALQRGGRQGEEAAAQVVQGVQRGVVVAERPAAVREHPLVGPGGDHLAEEGVVGRLAVRLGDAAAFEPGHAAGQQRQAGRVALEGRQVQTRELVFVAPAGAAHRVGHVGLRAAGQVQREQAAGQHQLARESALVDHHRHARRRELHRHRPGRRHHVALAAMCAGHQHRGAMVDQPAGMGSGDGLVHVDSFPGNR